MPEISPRTTRSLLLTTICVTAGLQSLRVLFPLIAFYFAPDRPFRDSALLLIFVFATPIWMITLRAGIGHSRLLAFSVAGSGVSRLALQVSPPVAVSFVLAVLAVIFTLMALPLALAWLKGNILARGIVLGFALDAALNSAFLTWDYSWRRDIISLACALILCGAMGVMLWRLRGRSPDTEREIQLRPTLWLALLGPYFMLQTVVLQNPAFVTAVSGASLPLASAVVLLGNVLPLSPVGHMLNGAPQFGKLCAGLALVGGLLTLNTVGGIVALGIALVVQIILTSILFALLNAKSVGYPGWWRTQIDSGLAGFLFLCLVALYYVGYQYPAPDAISTFVQAGAGGLLGLALLDKTPYAPPRDHLRLPHFAAALLLVPLALLLFSPGVARLPKQAVRLVVYNIHQGANVAGWIDLESLAAVIEAQQADVVVLQEAVRGQFITGATDSVGWLAARLGMTFRFAPATDHTYGEALLTHLPIQAWEAGVLPRAGTAQARSYIRVTVGDQPLTVIGTHLDHTSSAARFEQAQQLLIAWGGQPRTIIAGDLNAPPNTPEIDVFRIAGLVSAQDATGNAGRFTYPSPAPTSQIDWIFGTPGLIFSDFAITQTLASDHLPLAVTVQIDGLSRP